MVKENCWIINSREREDTTINNLSSYFQKNEKEDFKKTLSKLFKSSLWVIGKSVRKRQLQHSHDSNFSQVWKSLSHFQYFLAHFHSQLSLLQITLTNFYKLKDSSFIWKWIITIRCWKLEKLDKLVSIDVSILQVNFFYNDARFKKFHKAHYKSSIILLLAKISVLYTVSLPITFQLIKGFFVPLLFALYCAG